MSKRWYVTYGDQYLIAGPYETETEAKLWLEKQKQDYPDASNDWDGHVIADIDDDELPDWGTER